LTDLLACHLCGDPQLESSQKHNSRPVGRFLERFYSKSRGFICWC